MDKTFIEIMNDALQNGDITPAEVLSSVWDCVDNEKAEEVAETALTTYTDLLKDDNEEGVETFIKGWANAE